MEETLQGKVMDFDTLVIYEIYRCSMNPKNWRNVLALIIERMGALEATLMFYDAGGRSRNFAAAAIADEKMVDRFRPKIGHTAVHNENNIRVAYLFSALRYCR